MLFRTFLNLNAASVVALSVMGAVTVPVAAQTKTSSQSPRATSEIVVTAQRREERLSDVPLSVSAYGQDEMDRRSIATIDDIARITPNLNFANFGNTVARISVRGVNSDAGAGPTGLYINDVPIQVRQIGFNAFDIFPQVFDLQRVEVLRGPQGTLFGAGSEGGTVRFITPEASLTDFSGYSRSIASITKSGAPSFELGGAFGGPVIKNKLGFRASIWGNHQGGYIDRVRERTDFPGTFDIVDKDANSNNSYVGRFEFKWAPTPDLEITPAIFIQKQTINDSSVLWLRDDGPSALSSSFASAFTSPLVFSDINNGVFRSGENTRQNGDDRFYLPSLKVQLDTSLARLVVIGSYFDRRQTLADDFTTFDQVLFTGIINQIAGVSQLGFSRPVLPGQRATSFDVNEQTNYTVEARLESNPDKFGRIKWLMGFFYSRAEQSAVQRVEDLFLGSILDQQFIDLLGFGLGPDPIAGFFGIPLVDGRFIFDNLEKTKDRQIAGFMQVDYEIIDNVTLTAGFRVSSTNFSIFNEVVGPVLGPFTTDIVSQQEKPVTPKFAISWQPADDQLFYASVSKGFRIGGANAAVGLPCGVTTGSTPIPGTALGFLGLTDRPKSFDSDNLWSYEVGAKNSLLGGRIRTDVSYFHIDWNNIQQNIQLPACGFRYFDNLGSANIDGFEISASFTPFDNLFISTSIGYLNGEFSKTVFATPAAQAAGALPIVSKGDALPGSPLTINLVVEYHFQPLLQKDFYIRVDWDRTGDQDRVTAITNPANGAFDPRFPLNPVTNLVNLRLGAELVDDLEFSVFATNLLNSSPRLNVQLQPASTLLRGQTFRPRTVGVRAIYRFR